VIVREDVLEPEDAAHRIITVSTIAKPEKIAPATK